MALSKSEQKDQKDLNQLRPKKPIVAVKDQVLFQWIDDIFVCEKSYKTDKGDFRTAKADWRNFNIAGVAIVAVKGEKLSKTEYAALKTLTKDEQAQYIEAIAKPKAKAAAPTE